MLVALDRDLTVDVGEWADRRDPHQRLLSLEFVRWLAHDTDAEVWAIGNQKLVEEADVPGMHEIRTRLGERGITDEQLIEEYGLLYPERADRVRMVGRLFPDREPRIVVDDADLAQLEREGWAHYTAWEFVEHVERGALSLPGSPPVPPTDHPPVRE